MSIYEKLSTSAQYIQSIRNFTPQVGIILGSGLGSFVSCVKDQTIIPYADIPFIHQATVEGHEGRLILGFINQIPCAVLQGRLHPYEGYQMEDIVFPLRTLAVLGTKTMILTNAAGGINESYQCGDLVLITDHINLMGKNPLVGRNINELGPRFPDMTHTYSPKLRKLFHQVAREQQTTLKNGVYCSVLGPTFETPAEIKMMRILGGDMVGMSTAPESIAANHLGLKVAGISCITNMAAGLSNQELSHEEVKQEALKVMKKFSDLLVGTIEKIPTLPQ